MKHHIFRRLHDIEQKLVELTELTHTQNRVLKDISLMLGKGQDPRLRRTARMRLVAIGNEATEDDDE